MEEGSLAPAPVYSDVKTFSGRKFRGLVDAVIGGSPCTDLSLAGKRAGLAGARSGLFYEQTRIVEESEVRWCLWENVLGAKKFLPLIFSEFERIGYAGKGTIIRASDVGAPHQRARIFVLARRVADTQSDGRGERRPEPDAEGQARVDEPSTVARMANSQQQLRIEPGGRSWTYESDPTEPPDVGEGLADSDGGGLQAVRQAHDDDGRDAPRHDDDGRGAELVAHSSSCGQHPGEEVSSGLQPEQPFAGGGGRELRPEWPPGPDGDWSTVPPRLFPAVARVRRVADELAGGVDPSLEALEREALLRAEDCWADRLRMLGNGCVPRQVEEAIRFLYQHIDD